MTDLFSTRDRKKIGNKNIFNSLIDELNDLASNGMDLNIDDKKKKVYFLPSLLIGDNLALTAYAVL